MIPLTGRLGVSDVNVELQVPGGVVTRINSDLFNVLKRPNGGLKLSNFRGKQALKGTILAGLIYGNDAGYAEGNYGTLLGGLYKGYRIKELANYTGAAALSLQLTLVTGSRNLNAFDILDVYGPAGNVIFRGAASGATFTSSYLDTTTWSWNIGSLIFAAGGYYGYRLFN